MKSILLVNESRVTLELIKVYLIVKDVRVLEARDGADALVIARAERPDLVLSDLRLPGLDGLGLCRAFRLEAGLRDTPVILFTSEGDRETLRRCREAGARDVLMKPIGPRDLHVAVWRHAGIAVGLGLPVRSKLDRAG
jgi:CheY-like chemotaxis protein